MNYRASPLLIIVPQALRVVDIEYEMLSFKPMFRCLFNEVSIV